MLLPVSPEIPPALFCANVFKTSLPRGFLAQASGAGVDDLHGEAVQPENINIQVHPGYDHAVTMTPTSKGQFAIICNEYCGVNHHAMISRIYVK